MDCDMIRSTQQTHGELQTWRGAIRALSWGLLSMLYQSAGNGHSLFPSVTPKTAIPLIIITLHESSCVVKARISQRWPLRWHRPEKVTAAITICQIHQNSHVLAKPAS
jgi:hypothetical protein